MTIKTQVHIAFPQILKQFKETLSESLINLIITGAFPNVAKIAKIVPLYEKENKLKCNNYRPISLLSSIGKLIEKLLHKRLYSFLNRESSLVLSITHGVSQGLVLGQLLFLIYISDLNHVVKHSAVRHFADDSNLLYSSS